MSLNAVKSGSMCYIVKFRMYILDPRYRYLERVVLHTLCVCSLYSTCYSCICNSKWNTFEQPLNLAGSASQWFDCLRSCSRFLITLWELWTYDVLSANDLTLSYICICITRTCRLFYGISCILVHNVDYVNLLM